MSCNHACKYHLIRASNPEKESRWLLSPLYYSSEQRTDWNNILRSGGRWANIFNGNIYDDANSPEWTNELKRWAMERLAQSPNVPVDTLDKEFRHPSKNAFSLKHNLLVEVAIFSLNLDSSCKVISMAVFRLIREPDMNSCWNSDSIICIQLPWTQISGKTSLEQNPSLISKWGLKHIKGWGNMLLKQFLFSVAYTYIGLAHRKLSYFKHLLI